MLKSFAPALLFACTLGAQSAVLDLLDGETLYEGGRLLSLSFDLDREEKLRAGARRVTDPDQGHRFTATTTLAFQYGLRNNVQLGIAVPYVDDELETAAGQQVAAGIGDVNLLGKWRFHRWDAPHVSINTALITTLSLPTGDDDRSLLGSELSPEQQVGSGGVDPTVGLAITPEPGRWRFNAAVSYRFHTDSDGDGDRRGDAFFAELAIGNRFWLVPYPGPFMRFDAFVHYTAEERDVVASQRLADSGGERLTVGGTWAFRPRPSLDFQLSLEVPVWRDVNGTQLDRDWSTQFSFGYRF